MSRETHATERNAAGSEIAGPVMLALSTFRQSREAVDKALEQAAVVGRLVVVQVGRFAEVCLEQVAHFGPSLVVTTRSRRPDWVRQFFGSPVDTLIEKAGCSVLAV